MVPLPNTVAPSPEGEALPLAKARVEHVADPPRARRGFLDRLGVAASVTCAVHCAATPFLMAAFPALGFIGDERVEWLLFASVAAIGLLSLLPSYLRRHHDPKPLILFAIGVTVLIFARTQTGPLETALSVGGALVVASGHLLNLRRTRACAKSGHAHDHIGAGHDHAHDHAHDHDHDHAGHAH